MYFGRLMIAGIVAGLGVWPGTVESQSISDSSIASAIAKGAKSTALELATGESREPSARGYGFKVTITGPLNRIANASAEAKRKGLSSPSDSVVRAASAPVVLVEVTPKPPLERDGAMVLPPAPTRLVLRERGARAERVSPIQPDSVQMFQSELLTADGMTYTSTGMRAFFRFAQLPAKDLEVVVATSKSEHIIPLSRDMVRRVR